MSPVRAAYLAADATLALVRHGESTWIREGRFQGRGDPPLSAMGRRQAALAGDRLADPAAIPQLPLPAGQPRAAWHSPLRRTTETAEAIVRADPAMRNVRLEPLDDLLEIGQGEWEGLLHTEVRERYAAELAAWRRTPTSAWAPGGESLAQVGDRVTRGITSVLHALTTDGTVARDHEPVIGYPSVRAPSLPWGIVVAHDGVMRIILMTLLGVPYERFWSWPFALCCISVLDIRGGTASLRAHNLSDHLAPLEHESRAAAEARGDRGGAL